MNLFFVYDTTYCKADEDDPKDAVMYFFPSQASDSQHYLLCCQLAGITKFLKTTFSSPSVIGLDEGKFAFLWSGKYLLVLGASSHVKTSVLHDQLLFLCGIFCFYHGSLDNVLNESTDRQDCFAKLELAWSRYITLSQLFGNVLQISLSALPMVTYKKNSSVVATANRLLHMCQMSSFVVAGAVFYNSRILSTQFMPQLTNYLSLLSNSNAAAPVTDAVHFIKNLPPDVELKTVYLSSKSFSSILKHNHTFAGSRIRVKTVKSSLMTGTPLLNGGAVIDSGSEGDVDSGNCSENPFCNRNATRGKKLVSYSGLKSCKHKSSLCCSGHSRLFVKNLSQSRNHSSLKLMVDANHSDAMLRKKASDDSGFHFLAESDNCNQKYQSNFKAFNVFCPAHAQLLASSFLSKSKLKHTNFTSLSDSEFRCSLCYSYQSCVPFNPASVKQWNSDLSLSDSSHDRSNIGHFLKFLESPDFPSSETTKLQMLKCRSNSRTQRSRSSSASKRLLGDPLNDAKKSTGTVPKYRSSSSANLLDDAENLESNKLQKHVLYVQRYGGATLLLLLNKAFDEKVVNYLWNCGFTVLRDLEFGNDKLNFDSVSSILDSSFYTLLYNHVHKTLKEYPHSPVSLLTGRKVRETVQDIQQHFLSDPHFRMISLLSGTQGVFATQKDHQSAFYLEHDMNSKKLDSLNSLGKKATRRLEKLFKISL